MFSRFFIQRPRFAMVVSLVLVLTGLLCLTRLPVAEYPEITPPQLYVTASYTGASADVVMQSVAIPLEDQINGVDDLLYFSSSCSNDGDYTCTVTFQTGTDPDIAMVNLQNAVKRAEAKLPSEVTKTGVTVEERGSDLLAMFAFLTDGTTLTISELDNYVNNNIKDAVSRVEGVSSVEVISKEEYSLRIWLDPLRMAGLRLTVGDVLAAIQAQNLQAAVGYVGTEQSNPYVNCKLNVAGRLVNAREFQEIVLRRDEDGSLVFLRDIAQVELGKVSYSTRALFRGDQVVPMAIYRAPDANALSTVTGVKAELKKWEKRLPAGVTCQTGYDPTEFIQVSMTEILTTIILALVLVVFITWAFLQDVRATLVPSIAIPIALLGTFPFMLVAGYSINVLTMFGLILVIGSLCDDAIVVVENCQGLMEREGLSPREAALKTMEQITGAIIATTLVTVACYVPLAFYGGMVGNIYVQFAVTMCISLCLSTFVAMTLSPVICAYLLRPPRKGKAPLVFRPFNWLLDRSRGIYLTLVRGLVRRGLVTLVLFGGMVAFAWWLYGRTPGSFLPQEDKKTIMCNIELPVGASQARTNAAVEKFLGAVQEIPGVDTVMLISGVSMISAAGENVAMGIVQLDHWDKRKTPETSLEAILGEIQRRASVVPEARVSCFTPPAIMGLGATGGATFQLCCLEGADAGELSRLAGRFCLELQQNPEIGYAVSAFNADTPQLHLDVDREKAEILGLDAQAIFQALQGNFASIYVNDFTLAGSNYQVKIQAGLQDRQTEENIRSLPVVNARGEEIPLSAFATIRRTVGANQLMRFNKKLAAEINVGGAPGVSSSRVMDIVEEMPLPDGYIVEWTGMSYQERLNQGQLGFLMALAVVFAYLFLVAQYESWAIPIPVMLTVATAMTGALLGLWFCGSPAGAALGLGGSSTLSIYAQLGMVMLIGLTAKNAILMVEFSKQEREGGLGIAEAAVQGASMRYRAVLMTAWSFLFGVLPLVLARGAGAGSRQAIGVTTFSGMLLATLVGIVFTPALYAVFQRLREWGKGLLHWGAPAKARE
ncbi:MAG: efflux RND transporter permease subunit [Oligosphaeraceae bacterium]